MGYQHRTNLHTIANREANDYQHRTDFHTIANRTKITSWPHCGAGSRGRVCAGFANLPRHPDRLGGQLGGRLPTISRSGGGCHPSLNRRSTQKWSCLGAHRRS